MDLSKTDSTKTILVMCTGFLVVYTITDWTWAVYISLVLGLIGVLSPYLSNQVNFLWMKLTWVLSLIVPNIILTLIFYFLLFPLALLSRLFGSRTFLIKNPSGSVYKIVNKKFEKTDFENLW